VYLHQLLAEALVLQSIIQSLDQPLNAQIGQHFALKAEMELIAILS